MHNPDWRSPAFGQDGARIESQQRVFTGFACVDHIKLRHRLFGQTEMGMPLTRELVRRPAAAGVLIHDPAQQKFLLIEQFRIGAVNSTISAWQLEVVAGLIDSNETAAQAAMREAFEETGIQIDDNDMTLLHQFYPSAGACDEYFDLFVATADLSSAGGVHGAAEEGENILVHLIDYTDLKALLHSGRLNNAPVIIALQWLNFQISHPLRG
ncbi:MAG: NUDIX domain-containing protein [Pseudomonadota bacterium]|nr:NUDIX domain-containing protein [Pseudomonadota bacterium]